MSSGGIVETDRREVHPDASGRWNISQGERAEIIFRQIPDGSTVAFNGGGEGNAIVVGVGQHQRVVKGQRRGAGTESIVQVAGGAANHQANARCTSNNHHFAEMHCEAESVTRLVDAIRRYNHTGDDRSDGLPDDTDRRCLQRAALGIGPTAIVRDRSQRDCPDGYRGGRLAIPVGNRVQQGVDRSRGDPRSPIQGECGCGARNGHSDNTTIGEVHRTGNQRNDHTANSQPFSGTIGDTGNLQDHLGELLVCFHRTQSQIATIITKDHHRATAGGMRGV